MVEPIVIKFGEQQFGKSNKKKERSGRTQKSEHIIKYELISRFIRDIVTMYFEMGDKRMPTFWFINSDEANARFLPQFSDIYHNKTWVREWDYVHKMCNQFDKLIELDIKSEEEILSKKEEFRRNHRFFKKI